MISKISKWNQVIYRISDAKWGNSVKFREENWSSVEDEGGA